MAAVNIVVPFEIEKEEAINRLKNMLSGAIDLFGSKSENYNVEWNDNIVEINFNAKGIHASGKMEILDKEVMLAGAIPAIVIPFKSKIEEVLYKELEKALN